jgi:hypothetical protein
MRVAEVVPFQDRGCQLNYHKVHISNRMVYEARLVLYSRLRGLGWIALGIFEPKILLQKRH